MVASFPNPFSGASDRRAKVANYLDKSGRQAQWGYIFRGNLKEMEENQLIELLDILSRAFILDGGDDRKVWVPNQAGVFSFSSHYMAIWSTTSFGKSIA